MCGPWSGIANESGTGTGKGSVNNTSRRAIGNGPLNDHFDGEIVSATVTGSMCLSPQVCRRRLCRYNLCSRSERVSETARECAQVRRSGAFWMCKTAKESELGKGGERGTFFLPVSVVVKSKI